jgi:hypothetical protein
MRMVSFEKISPFPPLPVIITHHFRTLEIFSSYFSLVCGVVLDRLALLGVFGQYVRDDITVKAGAAETVSVSWTEESSGTELWRLGTPDKSAGEFKHGYARDTTHPREPNQYRI